METKTTTINNPTLNLNEIVQKGFWGNYSTSQMYSPRIKEVTGRDYERRIDQRLRNRKKEEDSKTEERRVTHLEDHGLL